MNAIFTIFIWLFCIGVLVIACPVFIEVNREPKVKELFKGVQGRNVATINIDHAMCFSNCHLARTILCYLRKEKKEVAFFEDDKSRRFGIRVTDKYKDAVSKICSYQTYQLYSFGDRYDDTAKENLYFIWCDLGCYKQYRLEARRKINRMYTDEEMDKSKHKEIMSILFKTPF